MIVDTSAAVAILLDEPERETLSDAIVNGGRVTMSSVSYLETSIVLAVRRGEAAFSELDAWLEAAQIGIVPFTAEQARVARRAYAMYGKGIHAAGLNFGDCASYALAIIENAPLLYKGSDFSKTDVPSL
jgi:ribonuclease VapC